MIIHFNGRPINFTRNLIGRVTRKLDEPKGHNLILILDKNINTNTLASNFNAVLTQLETIQISNSGIPIITNVQNIDHIMEGDILLINSNGHIYKQYSNSSVHNSLFVTGQCDSKCIMCSQPPSKVDDINYLYDINKKIIDLIEIQPDELGITGGEPSLLGGRLFELVEYILTKFNKPNINILTNGRNFSNLNTFGFTKITQPNRVVFSIPLHSDSKKRHDLISGCQGAFEETINGIYNLAKYKFRIEIRIILQKETIIRLFKTVQFISKNLPFVEHIAFMGIEETGYAKVNIKDIWIEPNDYIKEFKRSIEYLIDLNFPISIYNLQLCLLPESLWEYSCKSISEWKNKYFEACDDCEVKSSCCGFFTSTSDSNAKFIKPIKYD